MDTNDINAIAEAVALKLSGTSIIPVPGIKSNLRETGYNAREQICNGLWNHPAYIMQTISTITAHGIRIQFLLNGYHIIGSIEFVDEFYLGK